MASTSLPESQGPTSAPRPPPEGYTLVLGPPPVDAYIHLRTSSGLSSKSLEQATLALPNSWAFYHVVHDASQVVCGMGRVIGDGGWYFIIADMAVLQEHQRKGLGDWIMGLLLQKIRDEAPKGAYISLVAHPMASRLYERHGFQDISPRRIGMAMLS